MRNREFNEEMKKAADKFNLKPKNGIKFLIERGHLPSEPGEEQAKGIAKFFLSKTPNLSAKEVGAYLGGENELNGAVRMAYLHELDFSRKDVTFVGAQRLLLSGFRVPGEG